MTPSTKRGSATPLDKGEERISALIANLASRDPTVRTKARKALVAVGKPSVPSLIPLLSDRKPHLRWEAAKTLGGIADPITATALVNALEDSDSDVRWVAAEGLIALGQEGLEPLLAACLERDKSRWFGDALHHVCHTLAKKKRLGPILRPVLAALQQPERRLAVPSAAYAALSRLRETA